MEQRSVYGFIFIGTALRYLQDAREGWLVHGDGAVVENALKLEKFLDDSGMNVSAIVFNVEFGELLAELEGLGDDHVLDQTQAYRMAQAAIALRVTLLAEAQTKHAFVVADRRNKADDLLGGMSGLLSPGVYGWLAELSQSDLDSAGRCLAFGLPTSAGFHLMRLAEGALRQYYCCLVRQNRIKDRSWGPVIKALRAKTGRHAPPPELLDHLDHLRSNFRNPTQHPEMVYDIEDVQDLLGVVLDAINRMYRHLEKIDRLT